MDPAPLPMAPDPFSVTRYRTVRRGEADQIDCFIGSEKAGSIRTTLLADYDLPLFTWFCANPAVLA